MIAIQDTLRRFGITRCYKGFYHTTYTIYLATNNEERLYAVTKDIYMETAAHFGCSWKSVEHNIRTAVSRAWLIDPELLVRFAGYRLDAKPTASEFIEIIASHVIRSSSPQGSSVSRPS